MVRLLSKLAALLAALAELGGLSAVGELMFLSQMVNYN